MVIGRQSFEFSNSPLSPWETPSSQSSLEEKRILEENKENRVLEEYKEDSVLEECKEDGVLKKYKEDRVVKEYREDRIVKEYNEDIFRCETQMISTYTREEIRNPETRNLVEVQHAFSFCNHADLPDDVLEKVIRERWEDLFGLTGPQESPLVDDWPDKINITEEQVPGIKKIFPPSGNQDRCDYCNTRGLRELTGYYLKMNRNN